MREANAGLYGLSAAALRFGAEIQAAQSDGARDAGRLAAMCFHVAGDGHSCLDLRRLHELFPEAPPAPDGAGLRALFSANALSVCVDTPEAQPAGSLLVVFGERLYLKKCWRMETALVARLQARLRTGALPDTGDSARDLAALCLHKPLAVLTGGPGTGKTTAISGALVQWLQAFPAADGQLPRIVLCAPTGKAAARMSESWQAQRPDLLGALPASLQAALPQQAVTLHRLLGIRPLESAGRQAPKPPVPADLVVVDEASMIDMPLMLRLLESLSETCHLLLVGDPNQLPSVEIGNVLAALMAPGQDHAFSTALADAHRHLTRNHRQAASPGLGALARDILTQNRDAVVERLLQDGRYPQVRRLDAGREAIAAIIEDGLRFHRGLALLSGPDAALQALAGRIILSPVRQGPVGCETVNADLQRRLGHHLNRHGQAILVTENVPALGLSNGDIGLLWQDADGLKAYFRQPGGLGAIALANLPAHEPAYALTVHKAQGSEFGHVDLLLPEAENPLLSKALLYTAVTRARQSLRISASGTALAAALTRDVRRMNGLAAIAAFSGR